MEEGIKHSNEPTFTKIVVLKVIFPIKLSCFSTPPTKILHEALSPLSGQEANATANPILYRLYDNVTTNALLLSLAHTSIHIIAREIHLFIRCIFCC